jgi:hypothetical protein
VISDPKAPGIIKLVLRTGIRYRTCPLGADIAATARIVFPCHRIQDSRQANRERRACGASRWMCRSHWFSRSAISAREATRPSLMFSIQPRLLAMIKRPSRDRASVFS